MSTSMLTPLQVKNGRIQSQRLVIRRAVPADEAFIFGLWQRRAEPGAVDGKRTSVRRLAIRRRLAEQSAESVPPSSADAMLGQLLVVERRDTADPIGECLLHAPDSDGKAQLTLTMLASFGNSDFVFEAIDVLRRFLLMNTASSDVRLLVQTDAPLTGAQVGRKLQKYELQSAGSSAPSPHANLAVQQRRIDEFQHEKFRPRLQNTDPSAHPARQRTIHRVTEDRG